MQHLNYADYLILSIFGLSTLLGLIRGFLREVFSLCSWVAASVVSSMFSSKLAANFGGSSAANQSMLSTSTGDMAMDLATQSASLVSVGISFVFLFLGTLLIGSLVTKIVGAAADSGGLGLANRFLGAIFGSIRAFLIAAIMIFIVQLTPLSQNPTWRGASTVMAFQPVVKIINDFVQPNIANIKSKAQNLTNSVTEQIKNVGNTLGAGS